MSVDSSFMLVPSIKDLKFNEKCCLYLHCLGKDCERVILDALGTCCRKHFTE